MKLGVTWMVVMLALCLVFWYVVGYGITVLVGM